MAHYARLDENNVVVDVSVFDDNDDSNFEAALTQQRGSIWKKTSYNTRLGIHLLGGVPFRKNYAAIGGLYDPVRDAFIAPMPPSTTLAGFPLVYSFNEETCGWELLDES
jgi:hypothetical protein